MRLRGWLGRADETTKIKGMFVHPAQVIDVIGRLAGVTKGQLVVTRRDDRDHMTLELETSHDAIDLAAAARVLADITKLRGDVRIVATGLIGQNGAIVDQRTA